VGRWGRGLIGERLGSGVFEIEEKDVWGRFDIDNGGFAGWG
jgi:hypothetical protein